ncbi:hypothetical protein ONZ45_g8135 [Pleurotus djamor]|nr:hypothetical protein ONZ45_g8135 [Pleurotus djamor]
MIEEDGEYTFTRDLTAEDWAVFHRYVPHIKSLSLVSDDWYMYPDIIKAMECRKQLLPNLKHLAAPCDFEILRLFVHPHLLSLTIRPSPTGFYDNEDGHLLSATLTRISEGGIMPLRLRHFAFDGLCLRGETSFSIVEPALISLLRPLKDHLVTLTLRPTWLSINVTHSVAHFPQLIKLVSTDLHDVISDDPLTFSDALDPLSFSTLQHLGLMIRFDRAIRCFSSGIESLSRLTTLALVSDRVEHPADFTRLLSLIVQVSPLLTDLEVSSSQRIGTSPHLHRDVLTFEELKPLLQLGDLERLAIGYPTPLQLHYEDLKTIAQTFKHLSTLVLNPEPTERTHTTLHMSALSALSFSPNPHDLEDISLYVDTSPDRFPEADELVVLQGLQRLSFGYSSITKDAVIPSSVYLSRVVPLWFSAPSNLTSYHCVNPALWEEVVSLLPPFMRALQVGQGRAILSQQGLFSME